MRLLSSALPLAAALLIGLSACSEQQQAAPRQGKLYDYRVQLASGSLRKPVTLTSKPDNAIYNAIQAPARQCGDFWRTGDEKRAGTTPALCDGHAREFQAFVSERFGQQFSLDDVRDPALWDYLMPRIEGRG